LRTLFSRGADVFSAPGSITQTLLFINFAVFFICWAQAGSLVIPGRLLLQYGALYPGVLTGHHDWPLLAYGFLHVNPVHLVSNMICLVSWGGLLERRIGATQFLIVYLSALVVAGLVSLYGHPAGFVSVGASGAIAGVLGALVCLAVLDKLAVAPQFFVSAIGLNVLLAFAVPNIDWRSHIGGFAAGLIVCAILDLLARLNAVVLRCRFPEFAAFNLAVLSIAALWGLLDAGWLAFQQDAIGRLILTAALLMAVVKATDMILALKKGFVAITVLFALAYAVLPLLEADRIKATVAGWCAAAGGGIGSVPAAAVQTVCASGDGLPFGCAVAFFVLALIANGSALHRGLKDVGFIGTTLQAERRRHRGI
jgi:rhomboid protease GluP